VRGGEGDCKRQWSESGRRAICNSSIVQEHSGGWVTTDKFPGQNSADTQSGTWVRRE